MRVNFYERGFNNENINEKIFKLKVELLRTLVKKSKANELCEDELDLKNILLKEKIILKNIIKEENSLKYFGNEDIETIIDLSEKFIECDISKEDFIKVLCEILQRTFDIGLTYKDMENNE